MVFIISAVPDAPSAVEVADITSSSATLSWSAPANDGGTPITGYYVERSTNSSDRWVRQNKDLITEKSYSQDNLMEGTEYLYRVIAVNKRGESKHSDSSQKFTAKNPYGEYAFYRLAALNSFLSGSDPQRMPLFRAWCSYLFCM